MRLAGVPKSPYTTVGTAFQQDEADLSPARICGRAGARMKVVHQIGLETAPFPNSLPALTLIRSALALAVVLFHYQLQWPWNAMAWTGIFD